MSENPNPVKNQILKWTVFDIQFQDLMAKTWGKLDAHDQGESLKILTDIDLLNGTAVTLQTNGKRRERCPGPESKTKPYLAKVHSLMDARTFDVGDIVICVNSEAFMPMLMPTKIIAMTTVANNLHVSLTLETLEGIRYFAYEDDCIMEAESLPLNACPECGDVVFLGNDYMCWKCRAQI